jgi:hypothetical protein
LACLAERIALKLQPMKPLMTILAVTIIAVSSQVATGQQNSNPLLYFQRSNAYLETVSAAPHAQGMWGVTLGNPGDVGSASERQKSSKFVC